MNFLSHLYLSGDSEGLIIGNFIADSVKGSDHKNYPPEIQKGILLHRKIDSYTDAHPIVELSKQRLREKYRKYAGVIVDVFYDHYLAANWHLYSEEKLSDYTKRIHAIIERHHHLLPPNSVRFKTYMIQYNILEAYAKLEGIERVMQGMAQRARFVSNMEHSVHDLREHYELFEIEFKEFFPELCRFVNEDLNIK